MSPRHVIAAVVVMVIWGMNFVAIDKGLEGVPPLVFVALRFMLVLVALPFVPRPAAPIGRIFAVGAFMSLGQFSLLYTSLAVGMPPGLASLVLQVQAVFTVALAAWLLSERPAPIQVAGVVLGLAGLAIVAAGRGGNATAVGLVVCVFAAGSWAVGNVLVRRLKVPGGLGLTVWSALVVPLPLLLLASLIDSPTVVLHALTNLTWVNWASTLYTAILASLVGYGIWNSLLQRYPASSVAPFTLLVPPVGLLAAWLVDGERPTQLGFVGGAILILGVAIVVAGPRLLVRPARARSRTWPR